MSATRKACTFGWKSDPVLTVGFGGSIHDYATAVVDGDRISVAIEDERLTRKRHSVNSTNPLQPSFVYCSDFVPTINEVDIAKGANDTLTHCQFLSAVSPIWMNHHYTHAASAF